MNGIMIDLKEFARALRETREMIEDALRPDLADEMRRDVLNEACGTLTATERLLAAGAVPVRVVEQGEQDESDDFCPLISGVAQVAWVPLSEVPGSFKAMLKFRAGVEMPEKGALMVAVIPDDDENEQHN